MMNPHKITAEFEKALCDYCGSPYAVAVDNCSNALFLALWYELKVKGEYKGVSEFFEENDGVRFGRPIITIPRHTYMSVPNEIIHAGGKVEFEDGIFSNRVLGLVTGPYQLKPTNVYDAALRFTCNMYVPDTHMCLSFTGPFKHLKLGKGGAILTDDLRAVMWFKRARFSGRQECSYHEDDFDKEISGGDYKEDIDRYVNFKVPPIAGWNFYMLPEIAARGLLLMAQFYDKDGKPKHNEDLTLPYPDLSKFKLWQ